MNYRCRRTIAMFCRGVMLGLVELVLRPPMQSRHLDWGGTRCEFDDCNLLSGSPGDDHRDSPEGAWQFRAEDGRQFTRSGSSELDP